MSSATDRDAEIRARVKQHWEASESGDAELEHAIYATDAILDYPQSGERFRGRSTIRAQRGGNPAERHFTIRWIRGNGELWVKLVSSGDVLGSGPTSGPSGGASLQTSR